MRALVTVAPVFQDAGNAHAGPARRFATSIDTTDWRGCGVYDASYTSKYTLTPQGPACPPGLFCAISGQFFDCIPYSGGTVRTTCVDMSSTCSNCDNGYYESCYNTANPYCLTWHFGAAIIGWGCGSQPQEGSIINPNLTPWFPPTSGIPTALLTEAAITLVQGTTTSSITTPTSLTSGQSSETTTPVSIVTSTYTVLPTSSSPALSEGAKVGLGLGIPIAVLLIIAVTVLIYHHYWTRRHPRQAPGLAAVTPDNRNTMYQATGSVPQSPMQYQQQYSQQPGPELPNSVAMQHGVPQQSYGYGAHGGNAQYELPVRNG